MMELFASPPMRGRGLKSRTGIHATEPNSVAPYAGAWIEIRMLEASGKTLIVSPPMRGRGLKLRLSCIIVGNDFGVAPYAGAWIEIDRHCNDSFWWWCRPLCGGVD